jgi:chorismate mutase
MSREAIDQINIKLLRLLSERAQLVKALPSSVPNGRDRVREASQLAMLHWANPGAFSNAAIDRIFKVIFDESLAVKQRARGLEAAYVIDGEPAPPCGLKF